VGGCKYIKKSEKGSFIPKLRIYDKAAWKGLGNKIISFVWPNLKKKCYIN